MKENNQKNFFNNDLIPGIIGKDRKCRYMQLSPRDVEQAKEKLCLDRFLRLLASYCIDMQLKNDVNAQSKEDETYGSKQ